MKNDLKRIFVLLLLAALAIPAMIIWAVLVLVLHGESVQ